MKGVLALWQVEDVQRLHLRQADGTLLTRGVAMKLGAEKLLWLILTRVGWGGAIWIKKGDFSGIF
jgi:hypothetical protein